MCDCPNRIDRYPEYMHADILAGLITVDCAACYEATLYTPPAGTLTKAYKARHAALLAAAHRRQQQLEKTADLISHNCEPLLTGTMFGATRARTGSD